MLILITGQSLSCSTMHYPADGESNMWDKMHLASKSMFCTGEFSKARQGRAEPLMAVVHRCQFAKNLPEPF